MTWRFKTTLKIISILDKRGAQIYMKYKYIRNIINQLKNALFQKYSYEFKIDYDSFIHVILFGVV